VNTRTARRLRRGVTAALLGQPVGGPTSWVPKLITRLEQEAHRRTLARRYDVAMRKVERWHKANGAAIKRAAAGNGVSVESFMSMVYMASVPGGPYSGRPDRILR
jgi:hypothetical protein